MNDVPFAPEITRLFTAGKTYREIGADLGLTVGAVAGRCHRLGLVRTPGRRVRRPKFKGQPRMIPDAAGREKDQRDIDMLCDIDEGHSEAATAAHWGVSRMHVRNLKRAARAA